MIFLVIATINNSIGNILIKQSSSISNKVGATNFLFSPHFVLGITFFGLNIIFYSISLRSIPLSTAYPILAGGSFLITTVFSQIIFLESIDFVKVIGLVFITLGMSLVVK